ncbi:Helix-turn-helix domain-containing protein [Agreia bicolorata]|uniref:Helix-turn-helix domain-containing protein n=1 Tax=Agreia bicolorata TaxID=110935 RepID=A0A1T4Y3D0_9MICO|nr:helix-turn-helix transcriptional regulator [Agreia bicolorata]SKA96334.1 Helix-turn-helix domain-containing protein [Agreia bicolorata]
MTLSMRNVSKMSLQPRVSHVTVQHILLSGAWQGDYSSGTNLVVAWARDCDGVVVDDSGVATLVNSGSIVVLSPARRFFLSIYGHKISLLYLDSELLRASIEPQDDRMRDLLFATEPGTTATEALRGIISSAGSSLPGRFTPVDEMYAQHTQIARTVLRELSIARPRRVNAQLQRAVAVMYEVARTPATVQQIAAQLHMSVRSLQLIFQESLDTTPGRFLREMRLECARSELLRASAGLTVADTARAWQFGNPGRFSAVYREKFGELPSETLAGGGAAEQRGEFTA